ncbi:hypothetical protein LSAT2_009496 [Lamellibrachia satsuma]|nr:hypothetical protein LSAT2_009496 [Lamellibrachia satsuma]
MPVTVIDGRLNRILELEQPSKMELCRFIAYSRGVWSVKRTSSDINSLRNHVTATLQDDDVTQRSHQVRQLSKRVVGATRYDGVSTLREKRGALLSANCSCFRAVTQQKGPRIFNMADAMISIPQRMNDSFQLPVASRERRKGKHPHRFMTPYAVDIFSVPSPSANNTGASVTNEPAENDITTQSAARRGYDVINGAIQKARPHPNMENCKARVTKPCVLLYVDTLDNVS